MCECARPEQDASCLHLSLCLMSPRQGLSLSWSLIVLASLAGHGVLHPLSLPSSVEVAGLSLCLAFLWALDLGTPALMLAKALPPLNHLSGLNVNFIKLILIQGNREL